MAHLISWLLSYLETKKLLICPQNQPLTMIMTNHTGTFQSAGAWRFPHKTCEAMRFDGWVLQPYSALITAATSIILLAMMISPKRWSGCTIANNITTNKKVSFLTRASLFPSVLFEGYHAFSHIIHQDLANGGSHSTQEVIIHLLGYCMGLATFACFYRKYGISPNQKWVVLAHIADVINWFAYGGSLVAFFGLLNLISIVMSYFPLLESLLKKRIIHLSINTFILACQIIHESICCQMWVTKISPDIPYHIAIELYGFYLFLYLADTMFLLETHQPEATVAAGPSKPKIL